MNFNTLYKTVLAALAGTLALCLNWGMAMATITVKANHDHIDIDYNYHGSTVSARGVADAGDDIIITIASEEKHEQSLMSKDKVGGVLWMNTGKAVFKEMPGFYFVRSTKPLDKMLDADSLNKNVIGYSALVATGDVDASQTGKDKAFLMGEFIRYKESKGLYSAGTGDFEIKPGDKPEEQKFYTLFQWPYQAAPGKYVMTAYAVKDGRIVGQAQSHVEVESAGAVKFLGNLAKNQGALYGVLAILLALAAGFGVGMVFGKGGGAH